jgi:hypothetical protein
MADIQDLLSRADSEINKQYEALIKQELDRALKKIQITEQNLSQSLINLIMTSASQNQPIPERVELPKTLEQMCEDPIIINKMLSEIVNDLYVGNNVYLYGVAGTGKSYLAANIAKYLGIRLYELNCSQWTSPIQLIGGQTINGYEQGMVIKAWQNGGMLLLDELPKLDPNTAGLLNPALAKSADKVKVCNITKEAYDKLKAKMGTDKTASIELVKKDGEYFRYDYPTIVDGKGEQIRKSDTFFVIATGNTNLKDTGSNYSGNNRQDYSLVDRFAGSFYQINYDVALEKSLIYPKVYSISNIIRDYLNDKKAAESISLRTMLNFNRIYEQEMLRRLNSKYAMKVLEYAQDRGEPIGGKTLKESVYSFLDTLNDTQSKDLKAALDNIFSDDADTDEFIAFFVALHKLSPI